MRTIGFWAAAAFFLLAACQKNPTVMMETAVPATAVSIITPTTETADTIYLPAVQGPAAATIEPTITAALSAALSAAPSATPTPQPTATPAYPIYNGPPLNRQEIGIQIHLHRENLDWLISHLKALDVGWVKVQISWKLYQSAPDQFTADRFAELDALVNAAQDNDIAVILSVSKAPEWSRPTTEMDGPPTDFALYGRFMRHLAARYRGRVAAYELWNEPNLRREWNGSPLSAADLVALIRIGANGVRAADPAATLISAAPATTGINDGINAIDDRVFLREMLAAGVADVVDAIGVHPYGWANPPDSSMSQPGAAPSHNNHPSFFFADTLYDYAAILTENNAATKPLWVTEFGWGSFDNFDAPPPAEAAFMANTSEWQQAEYTLRAFELAQEWEFVGPMILWNLNFAPTLGDKFSVSGYSLLRPDGSPRPAYHALQSR